MLPKGTLWSISGVLVARAYVVLPLAVASALSVVGDHDTLEGGCVVALAGVLPDVEHWQSQCHTHFLAWTKL